jgi:hypothetical protein
VLDDYSPLRALTEESLEQEAIIFPIKKALEYVESNPLGGRGVGSQGASLYAAPNPDFGASFTYFIKEKPKSPKELRQENEKQAREEGRDIDYPSYEDFVAEDTYEDPYLLFLVKDASGNEVRKIKTAVNEGVQRISWNLRYPATTPILVDTPKLGRYSNPNQGPLVIPGNFTVEMWQSENGVLTSMVGPTAFNVEALENSTLDRQTEATTAFKKEVQELRRKIRGSLNEHDELNKRLKYIKKAVQSYPGADIAWMEEVKGLEATSHDIRIAIRGDHHKSSRDVETIPGTASRIENIVGNTWYSTSNPTTTNKEQYELALEEYAEIRADLDALRSGVQSLESRLDSRNIPYTPHRPNWKED